MCSYSSCPEGYNTQTAPIESNEETVSTRAHEDEPPVAQTKSPTTTVNPPKVTKKPSVQTSESSNTSNAADHKYQIDDRVRVKNGDQWSLGKVVSVQPELEIHVDGYEMPAPLFAFSHVELADKNALSVIKNSNLGDQSITLPLVYSSDGLSSMMELPVVAPAPAGFDRRESSGAGILNVMVRVDTHDPLKAKRTDWKARDRCIVIMNNEKYKGKVKSNDTLIIVSFKKDGKKTTEMFPQNSNQLQPYMESILEQKVDKYTQESKFLVKWEGVPEEEATWETYENLEHFEKFRLAFKKRVENILGERTNKESWEPEFHVKWVGSDKITWESYAKLEGDPVFEKYEDGDRASNSSLPQKLSSN